MLATGGRHLNFRNIPKILPDISHFFQKITKNFPDVLKNFPEISYFFQKIRTFFRTSKF
jgi:hypothetical protein